MSEDMFAEPGITKKVHFGQNHRESIVDIYVSAESLRVYDNPWVEGTSTSIATGAQHPVSVVTENSRRRKRTRTVSVFQCVVYLLLLAGIMALIFLGVQMKNDKTSWRKERNQLLAVNAKLEKIRDQLIANNTELKKCVLLCGQKDKKCKNWPEYCC